MTDIKRENEARRRELVNADEATRMREIVMGTISARMSTIAERAGPIVAEMTTEAEITAALDRITREVLTETAALAERPGSTPSAGILPEGEDITLEDLSKETGIAIWLIMQAASIVLELDDDEIDASTVVSTVRTPARHDSEAEGIRKLAGLALTAYRALDPRAA